MPSIDLVRLKIQIAGLADTFSDPIEFKKRLHLILDFYSRRSLRQSKTASPKSLIPTFNCHPQIIKQIASGLHPDIVNSPQEALFIADYLWQDSYLESQQIAAMIIGTLPPDFSPQVIDRIMQWAHPNTDRVALELLINESIKVIQSSQLDQIEDLIYTLLHNQDPEYYRIGLSLMQYLIREPEFSNVPSLFKLLSPFILEPKYEMAHREIQGVITAFIVRTPIETSFYLQQLLHLTPGAEIEKVISRYISLFPQDQQSTLQTAIRNHRN